MNSNTKQIHKEILKTLAFILPYVIVEFTNTILVIIDKSISNSIGKTAIIVFSSFMTLNWAINTIQTCLSQSHNIVLVRDKENSKTINTTGIFIELISSLIISVILFIYAEKITYVYQLENEARNILIILLKLKSIQLPLASIGYIAENDLKAKKKTKQIFIITVISSIVNIGGDLISIKLGYNEIGIYIATIVSTIINTVLLFIASRFEIGKVTKKYVIEIIKYGKDLVFNKIVQRIVNIWYTSIASSFGTEIYAIHCACIAVPDTLCEIINGYYSGLVIKYSYDIEEKKENLMKKVDMMQLYGIVFSIIILAISVYPTWWILSSSIPWNECNPYIWFYSLEFIAEVISINYSAYLSANKDTKAIRNMALIGGICVRMPLALIIQYFNIGIIGLSFVCAIDRTIRALYLRLYIQKAEKNKTNTEQISLLNANIICK